MLAWDHNAHHHRLLLRHLPPEPRDVLDVGCGTGQLALRLATRAHHVTALDRDPRMVEAARAAASEAGATGVQCVHADIADLPLEPASFDAVVSLSALHHLPPAHLAPVLAHLGGALRPGGVLAVIALPRVDLPREVPVEVAALAWHHLLGVASAVSGHPPRAAAGGSSPAGAAPTRAPVLTTGQVRAVAGAVLPGVQVRRLVVWRYLLTWRRPQG